MRDHHKTQLRTDATLTQDRPLDRTDATHTQDRPLNQLISPQWVSETSTNTPATQHKHPTANTVTPPPNDYRSASQQALKGNTVTPPPNNYRSDIKTSTARPQSFLARLTKIRMINATQHAARPAQQRKQSDNPQLTKATHRSQPATAKNADMTATLHSRQQPNACVSCTNCWCTPHSSDKPYLSWSTVGQLTAEITVWVLRAPCHNKRRQPVQARDLTCHSAISQAPMQHTLRHRARGRRNKCSKYWRQCTAKGADTQ